MDTIKINKGNAKMVAHRGVSGMETENTAAAFVAAGSRSYFGVETDVRVTRDGAFVVFHDNDTERISGEKKIIQKTKFEKLRALTLKDSVDGEKRWDLRIATLAEYLRICKKYDKHCVIEIKSAMDKVQLKKVVKTVEAYYALAHVTFITFNMDNLIRLREILPQQPMQFLTDAYSPAILEKLDKYNFDLDIQHGAVTKAVIDEVHAHGHEINCWTVDDKTRAEEIAAWGADYITSNILE